MRNLIRFTLENRSYIWIDAVLVKEAQRAILIIFDTQKIWIPKTWIAQIKQNIDSSIKIEISDYRWAKKIK